MAKSLKRKRKSVKRKSSKKRTKSKKISRTRKMGRGRSGKGRDSRYLINSKESREDRYLKCPYCGAIFESSRDLIKLGTGTIFTTRSRKLYGCYNCKKILGISSKDPGN